MTRLPVKVHVLTIASLVGGHKFAQRLSVILLVEHLVLDYFGNLRVASVEAGGDVGPTAPMFVVVVCVVGVAIVFGLSFVNQVAGCDLQRCQRGWQAMHVPHTV